LNAPASQAALDAGRDLAIDAIAEAAQLAEHFAALAAEAAEDGDLAALRLRLCMASRALRSALECFAFMDGPT
jgi:hypothetical protein